MKNFKAMDKTTIAGFHKKYIIAVIGDAGDGKTTTINKTYDKLVIAGKLTEIRYLWGMPDISRPTFDFSLTGTAKYGKTGMVSRGDQICALLDDLYRLADEDCNVIVCACRKHWPDTFKSIAEIAWEYGYYIDWVKFDRPAGMSKDEYTDILSSDIAALF